MSAINNESNNRGVENKARSLMMNQQRAMRNRQQSMLSRSAAEFGPEGKVSE